MAVTPYAETEALLALLNGDEGECERILLDCLPGELGNLARVAGQLRDMAHAAVRIVHRRQQQASDPGPAPVVREEVDRAISLIAARRGAS